MATQLTVVFALCCNLPRMDDLIWQIASSHAWMAIAERTPLNERCWVWLCWQIYASFLSAGYRVCPDAHQNV